MGESTTSKTAGSSLLVAPVQTHWRFVMVRGGEVGWESCNVWAGDGTTNAHAIKDVATFRPGLSRNFSSAAPARFLVAVPLNCTFFACFVAVLVFHPRVCGAT